LSSIIIGKVIFYFLYELARKGINYFSGKKNYKDAVKKILDSISNNKSLISDISKIIEMNGEIDNAAANKIVNLPYVKTQIIKMSDSTNGELTETELENELKTILIKSWGDLGNKAVDKIKKDLK
jgi:hypothetical protein